MAEEDQDELPSGRLPPWCNADELTEIQGDSIEVAIAEHSVGTAALGAVCAAAFERIGAALPDYQMRDAQVQMAQQILRSFYRERNAVIEAATGVGKSFAYVVASLAYNYLTGERVLIATETKALQWQLFEKDLPFIRRALDPDLRFELCLGSANYFCRLRYEQMINEGSFRDLIEEDKLAEVRAWAGEVMTDFARSGSRFEDTPKIPESVWRLVTRDSDGCPANRCPHYGNCNYYRERKKWSDAQLLVANHHLLLFHLLNDKHTLPEYGAVVIDEAHGLIRTGYSIFTASFARNDFADLKKGIDKLLISHTGIQGELKQEIEEVTAACLTRWETFFSRWEVETDMVFQNSGTALIRANIADTPEINAPLIELAERYDSLKTEDTEASLLGTINAQLKQIRKMAAFAGMYSKFDSQGIVYWAEKRDDRFLLQACRLNLGETLADLMPELRLYTSATIGYWPFADFPSRKSDLIQRGFFNRFLGDALPLAEEGSVDCNIFFSPFNYREHAALYAPEHLLIPEHGSPPHVQAEYFDRLAEEIAALTSVSGGGALVLFTSNYNLQQIAERLVTMTDLEVISQLEDGVQDSLARFRRNKEAILLGSQSFWQGIDVAGDGLRLLIITKLLFTPPDDPIFKARSEILEAKGKRPFFDLSLPHASTMLRQAFGRLIRTERDKGVIALLDSRIWQKTYGKTLIANLPRVQVLRTFAELERANDKFGLLKYSQD
ncbi:ATP-dependent DNA helicase [Turneriella parva]|uniref:DNA 5'-3' helicase n=1 Tax=Turneriella parva (strain ATCC BAA-1111 / DSM 21527 / NCTC 11395 / H) TaxID=869212 RepID=I4B8A7_TURPD|nr:ATP-dependent DNA helicase [Turneriella parva]AFM13514.1 helicase c2 [Turneriella parva DSM 21527]